MGRLATSRDTVSPGTGPESPNSVRHVGAVALVAFLSLFILTHTNLVLFTGLFHYYDGRRILQITLLGAMTLVVVVSPRLREGMIAVLDDLGWVTKTSLSAVAALGVVSSLRAPMPAAGLREVALFALLGLLAIVVTAARRALDRPFDRTMIVTLVAAAFIYVPIFIIVRRAQITMLGFESLSVRPQFLLYGWSNARMFGQVGLWVFPLLVAAPMLLRERSRVTRGGAWLVALCWWALVIEAGGRGSIIFTVVAVAVVAVLLGGLARTWAAAAATVIAGGTAVWFAASRLVHFLYGPDPVGGAVSRGLTPSVERAIERGASDNNRFAFWQDAVEMVRSAPLLGVGPEHYAYYGPIRHTAAPHNVPLQIAAEWGVPAALVLAGLTIWAGSAWIRKWRGDTSADQHTRTLVPALTAAVLGAGMLSMVEGVIVTPASQVMLALVLGWMLAVYRTSPDRTHARSRTGAATSAQQRGMAHIALGVSTVVLAGTLVWTAGPYLWAPNETLDRQIEEHSFGTLAPRFWVQGRLFDE